MVGERREWCDDKVGVGVFSSSARLLLQPREEAGRGKLAMTRMGFGSGGKIARGGAVPWWVRPSSSLGDLKKLVEAAQ